MKRKRRYTSAPQKHRCQAICDDARTMGEPTQCMRWKVVGDYCRQHAALVEVARRVAGFECTCHDFGENAEGFQCESCQAKDALELAGER